MTLDEREKTAILFDKYKNLLSQSQRQALQLYLFEDLTLSEIADVLATSRQAVYDSVRKGKTKLLKLEKEIDES